MPINSFSEFTPSPESPPELSQEEVASVLSRLPLIVVAEDEPPVHRAMVRVIANGRDHLGSTLGPESNMSQRFDAIPQKIEMGQLPLVSCYNADEAKIATEMIRESQMEEGVLIFDHCIGIPNGLDLFKASHQSLSPRIVRILTAATMPEDADQCLKTGILDLAICKPFGKDDLRAKIARACLRKSEKRRSSR